MKNRELKKKLKEIISEVFNIKESSLPQNPGLGNPEEWDSLGHLDLILTIEKKMKIKFPTIFIPKLTSLDLLSEEISKHAK